MLRRGVLLCALLASACSSDPTAGASGATAPSQGSAASAPSPAASASGTGAPGTPGNPAAPDGSAPDAASGPDPCAPIPGAKYDTTSVTPETKSPATQGDTNLLLRKWQPAAGQTAAQIDINGPTDTLAPRLYTLFTDDRMPTFSGVYQVQGWDWGCNCAVPYMTAPPVSMAGYAMAPAEIVELPASGYDIGGGNQAMVLYATTETITLKYTHEDDVVHGYTIHLASVCVEPALKALYDQCHAAGRTSLPVLRGNQPLGRVRGAELLVTIRDTGSWMDPRSRKDWYQK
jgi:hypothetical protein